MLLPDIPITFTQFTVIGLVAILIFALLKRDSVSLSISFIAFAVIIIAQQSFNYTVYTNTGLEEQNNTPFNVLNSYAEMAQDDSDVIEDVLGEAEGVQYLVFFRYDCESCQEFFDEYGDMLREKDNVWFINSRSVNGAVLVDELRVYSVPAIYCYENGGFTELALYDDNDEVDSAILELISSS